MPERPPAPGPVSRNSHLYLGTPKLGERPASDNALTRTTDVEAQKVLDQTARLWGVGKHRNALALLKTAVRKDPDATALRIALAEYYREMNCPDQAGRWGIVQVGWTDAVERDRLARLLAPVGIPRDDLANFLLLTGPIEAYPDLEEVVDGPLAEHVMRRRADAADESPWGERFFTLAAISWATTVLVWILAAMVLFVVAVFEIADAPTVARISAACVLVVMAIACWASAAGFLVERKRVGGAVFAIIGAIAMAVAVVTIATLR